MFVVVVTGNGRIKNLVDRGGALLIIVDLAGVLEPVDLAGVWGDGRTGEGKFLGQLPLWLVKVANRYRLIYDVVPVVNCNGTHRFAST